jgi:hypothetical protein
MSYQYKSTLPLESTTCPGVKFTLRKMSERKRHQFYLAVADSTEKIRGFLRDAQKLQPQVLAAAEDMELLAELTAEAERINQAVSAEQRFVIDPAWVRYGLKSVDGLEIDGEPATIDTLLGDDGPSELVQEIAAAIKAASVMPEAQLKNFVWPIISGEAAAEIGQSTTARSADSGDTGATGTVSDISPST